MGEVVDRDSAAQGESKFCTSADVLEAHHAAFGWMTIAGSVGSMAGAALSGYLAEPSGRVPIFADVQLFESKPYLLPGLVLFVLCFVSASSVLWLVPEVRLYGQP
jgi:MFS family permease